MGYTLTKPVSTVLMLNKSFKLKLPIYVLYHYKLGIQCIWDQNESLQKKISDCAAKVQASSSLLVFKFFILR